MPVAFTLRRPWPAVFALCLCSGCGLLAPFDLEALPPAAEDADGDADWDVDVEVDSDGDGLRDGDLGADRDEPA